MTGTYFVFVTLRRIRVATASALRGLIEWDSGRGREFAMFEQDSRLLVNVCVRLGLVLGLRPVDVGSNWNLARFVVRLSLVLGLVA